MFLPYLEGGNGYVIRRVNFNVKRGYVMESQPMMIPAPAIVEQKGKPVVIRPPEVGSAHDFAVIGYIITLLMSIPWLLVSFTIASIGVLAYLGYVILPPVVPAPLLAFPYLGSLVTFVVFLLSPSYVVYLALGGGGLLVSLLFLGAIYFGMVRNISKGRYEKARGSSLFFAVLFIIPCFFVLFSSLLSGTIVALIPAFFFMLTYGRLGEVIAKYGPVAVMGEAVPGMPGLAPPMPGLPAAPIGAPMGGPMPMMGPPMPGQMGPPPGSAPPRNPQCPTCGNDLYYSANHRRWYCQNCDNPGHR